MKCTSRTAGCVAHGLKIGLLVITGIAAVTWIVMYLWNALLPDLFIGVSPIGYWQALGVLILSRILFGGLRGGHHRWHDRHAHWEKLSAEEREQLRGRFHSRWHRCCGTSAGTDDKQGAGDSPAA